jgi:hypothetical protein
MVFCVNYSIDNGFFSAYPVLNTPTKPLSPIAEMMRNHGGFSFSRQESDYGKRRSHLAAQELRRLRISVRQHNPSYHFADISKMIGLG